MRIRGCLGLTRRNLKVDLILTISCNVISLLEQGAFSNLWKWGYKTHPQPKRAFPCDDLKRPKYWARSYVA